MHRSLFLVVLLISVLLTPSYLFAQNLDACRVKVLADDTLTLRTQLERAGYDVAGRNGPEGFVEVIASPAELARLEKEGFPTEIIERYGDRKDRSVPAEYNDYYEMLAILNATVSNYPDLVKMIDLGQYYEVGPTVENRNVYVMKVSDNVQVDEDEPNILLTLCRHAREVTTLEYGLWTLEKLTTQYTFNADVKKWVDNNQIYIVVCMNPDGKQYCHDVYDYWRKNRTPFGGGDYGVDLNRNYAFNWDGPYGGSTDPGSDTYRGPSANSEQETKCEIALAQHQRFAKVLDFHSYGREMLYTYYSSSSMPSTIENYLRNKAIELSNAFNYGDYRKASAEGEAYQWELCNISSFSFLVETGDTFIPSYASAVSEWNNHIWPGIQAFFDHEIPLRGHVKEAITGDPIRADISIQGINYTQGELRRTEPQYGSFSYFLPAGTYTITFTATGYTPVTKTVQIVNGKSTLLEVQMGTGPLLTVNGLASQDNLLDLDFDWPAGAGQIYLNGISLGKDTGFTFKNGVHVPLNWDILYTLTVGALPGWIGYLDGTGHAEAQLFIPRDPEVLGLTVYMGYFCLDAVTRHALTATSAVDIYIDPQ